MQHPPDFATYRLVHSGRAGGAIQQTTLLKLGSHVDLPQGPWSALARPSLSSLSVNLN